jgi:MscS family membrane protein
MFNFLKATSLFGNWADFLKVCTITSILVIVVYTQRIEDALGEQAPTLSQALVEEAVPFQPVFTDSPRSTLKSFLQLSWEFEDTLLAYQEHQTRELSNRVWLIAPQFFQLIDFSSVPKATQWDVGVDVIASLLDIMGRVNLPHISNVPDSSEFANIKSSAKWVIPNTPISIVRIEQGAREGEFLFSNRTVVLAPSFAHRIEHLPLHSKLAIENWSLALPQFVGPMIPVGLVIALPDSFKQLWKGTPVWKIIFVFILILVSALLLLVFRRMINAHESKTRLVTQLSRLVMPIAIILVISGLQFLFERELNVSGDFAGVVDFATALIIDLSEVWLFWFVVLVMSEWIILSPKVVEESLDANLLRMIARVIGFVGAVIILAAGIQDLGVPVVGLVAGLGVGGLAVALAIRPTLENLIGGAILYMDRPVRVGDYCDFGAYSGTVERIGVRSTQIRTTDRTLITIPNATFVDMEIVNWAKCDRMLISSVIGLRYETEGDQLRYVLVKLREMFYAHPMIDRNTVRVRFDGYGESSLDVKIRVYALTREWNEFYAIKEDVFLRVKDIIAESGTGFAFPSRTLYMSQDDGLDSERSDTDVQQVKSWRNSSQLPFPNMPTSRVDQLAGTLDYPPDGSTEHRLKQEPSTESVESLSTELRSGDEDEVKK